MSKFSVVSLPVSTSILTQIERSKTHIVGNCKYCGGTGYSGIEKNDYGLSRKIRCKKCTPKLESASDLLSCGIPYRFAMDLDDFHDSLDHNDRRFIDGVLSMFKKNPNQDFNLCLSSPYKGVGKTGTAIILFKKMMDIVKEHDPLLYELPFTFVSVGYLTRKFYQMISFADDPKLKAFMDSVFMNQFLLMDGLGDHFSKSGVAGDEQYVTNKLEELIRYRQGNGLTTIATSNYNLYYTDSHGEIINDIEGKQPSLLTKYGERFVGLWINGNCRWYDWKTTEGIRGMSNAIEWPE